MTSSEITIIIRGPSKVGKSTLAQDLFDCLESLGVPTVNDAGAVPDDGRQEDRMQALIDNLNAGGNVVRILEEHVERLS